MDSKTTTPVTPDLLAAMLQNATIDKAEKSEFSNSARDMFKFAVNNNNFNFTKEGENLVLESSDVIDFFQNVVQPFVAEVHKNDQSRSTVGETTAKDGSEPVLQVLATGKTTPRSSTSGDLVDIIDIVPPEPSSLPVNSIADRYTRSMLKCLVGYPLYNPKPFCELSKKYPLNGINIGDVGFVRGSGTFDFMFNIYPSQNGDINPPNLPDGFSLETPDHSATTVLEPLPANTRLFQSPITKTKSGEYICEDSEGAVLELPQGAIQSEATKIRPFEKLAARNGVQWYEYTMNRGRSISNGSLYLITSVTKCAQWGIAVFDRPCTPGQGLKFEKKRSLPFGKSSSKYRWKGSDTFSTKVSNSEGDAANQCVFVRGYKIMIRQDIFDNLCNDKPRRSGSVIPISSPQAGSSSMTRQPATRIRGGGGPDPASKLPGAGLFSRTTITKSDEEVVLHPNFNSSLVHPSDLVNAALLSQNPGAKVALMHDDVWCNLLRENFPKLNYATLIAIARSYTNIIDDDCVCLEKISNSSNVLEDSSHLLQRTRTPTFQGPLLPLVDDDAFAPAGFSITLPHELVERILLLLDAKHMLKCRLVNKEFNAIIQSSTLMQYYLACKVAGVIDNPNSPLSYAERFEALKKQEEAWRKLVPAFETTIKVIDQPSKDYVFEVTAGYYLFSNQNWKDLYYCHLPSSPQDNPHWFNIPGNGPGQSLSGTHVVCMGMAVYEHDLVVNIISSEVGNQAGMQQYTLDLVCLKFSTGEYHPLAHRPLIHVQRLSEAQPYAVVRIVGDNLALLVCDGDDSKLFIFDWKTGYKRLQHKATEYTYYNSVPAFLSPEVLLVPNVILSCFEVWHLFPSDHNSSPPVQILSLKIPAVSDNYSIIHIRCHGELSPLRHSMPYFPQRPFFPSENSIIVVSLLLGSRLGFRSRSIYKLIMHRCALLDIIQKWVPYPLSEQHDDLPTWLTNEVTVREVTDPDSGLVGLDAQSELLSTLPQPGYSLPTHDSPTLATSPTSHIGSSLPSGSGLSTSRYSIFEVQWADWGPSISRWLQLNETNGWGFCQSTGQRYVFLDRNPHDNMKCIVGIADFNLHNVRRNAEMMAQLRGEGEDNGGGNDNNGEGKKEEKEKELELLDHEGVFSEEVYMGLKCVVYHAPGEYDFDAVFMDEARLLGLKRDSEKRVESIEVLYIG